MKSANIVWWDIPGGTMVGKFIFILQYREWTNVKYGAFGNMRMRTATSVGRYSLVVVIDLKLSI